MSETAAGPKHPRRTPTPSGSQRSGRLRENPDHSPRQETHSRAEGESLSVPGGCFLLHIKKKKEGSLCLDRLKLNMWLPFAQTGGGGGSHVVTPSCKLRENVAFVQHNMVAVAMKWYRSQNRVGPAPNTPKMGNACFPRRSLGSHQLGGHTKV